MTSAKQSTGDHSQDAVVVTHPDPSINEPVVVITAGSNTGFLCRCNGTVQPNMFFFDGLYMKILPASAPRPLAEEVVNSPDPNGRISGTSLYPSGYTPGAAAVSWSANGKLQSSINAKSVLYVVERGFDNRYNVTLNPPKGTQVGGTVFQPTQVTACPNTMASTGSSSAVAATAAAATTAVPTDVYPSAYDGNWIYYAGLTAGNWFFGNRLMLGSGPLRANLIAVAAQSVNWRYQVPPENLPLVPHVRRAAGDLAVDFVHPDAWRFSTAISNSIVAWQKAENAPSVIASHQRKYADLVHLDPSLDVLMQVNYFAPLQPTITGNFSVWVKIIS